MDPQSRKRREKHIPPFGSSEGNLERRFLNRHSGAMPAQGAAPLGPSRNDGRAASDGFSLFRLQLQRRRIDAVTQSRRGGAVLEHMAEMAVAL